MDFRLNVLRTESMFLDTLGYLQYLHGDYQKALQTMNLEEMEALWQRVKRSQREGNGT